MSGDEVVAIVWLIVFAIGVVVGVIVIIALSALRDDRKNRSEPEDPDDMWPERDHAISGIPGHWDDTRPYWPNQPNTDQPGTAEEQDDRPTA